MLTKPKNTDVVTLDDVIAQLTARLVQEDPATETYAHIADQLVKVYKLKETDSKRRVSPDAWVSAGTALAGVWSILAGEKSAMILTSKALNIAFKAFR